MASRAASDAGAPAASSSSHEEHPKDDAPAVPAHIMRAIYGEQTVEEKRAAYNKSIGNWWSEYAARKNDEEEEHVADTLLYDERCHLPRTAPRPDEVPAAKQEPMKATR